jgi:hypothetical protein
MGDYNVNVVVKLICISYLSRLRRTKKTPRYIVLVPIVRLLN